VPRVGFAPTCVRHTNCQVGSALCLSSRRTLFGFRYPDWFEQLTTQKQIEAAKEYAMTIKMPVLFFKKNCRTRR